jgi:hypothetical protein
MTARSRPQRAAVETRTAGPAPRRRGPLRATICGRIAPERAAAIAIPLMRLLDAVEAELARREGDGTAARTEATSLLKRIRNSRSMSGQRRRVASEVHRGAAVETAAAAPSTFGSPTAP